jgi:uracil-DNA glycosylase family 4
MRAWLRLQQDFGGDEVIFDVPVDIAAALQRTARLSSNFTPQPGGASVPAPRPQQVAEVAGTSESYREPPKPATTTPAVSAMPPRPIPAGGESSWRKDLPPVPGPGLSIMSGVPAGVPDWPTLEALAEVVCSCTLCPLSTTRTRAVPGEGNHRAALMVIGEGPGETEDLTGRPFVGRAGELLDRMLLAIEIPRAEAYIANVVKCRPPRNRVPLPDERAACMPYLQRQIALVRPRVLLALGGTAAEAMLGAKASLGALRNKVHHWNGIPLVVTYHPAALLRNPNWKRPAWDDVRIARQLLDDHT